MMSSQARKRMVMAGMLVVVQRLDIAVEIEVEAAFTMAVGLAAWCV